MGLLGQYLIRRKGSKTYLGRIVETEAYLGLEDPSCHSFHGKVTDRTEVFYREKGHVYVYMIYGVHYCLNFITGEEKAPEAVLIRVVEPLYGIDDMIKNRNEKNVVKLCNGLGKICRAFEIDKHDNAKLTDPQILGVLRGDEVSKKDIVETERIGLNPGQDSSSWPLRFYIQYNGFISRP
jgi:DNA-3-methyladenine glycosylase